VCRPGTSERQEFVAFARQEEATIAALCRHFGISRETGDTWLAQASSCELRGAIFQIRGAICASVAGYVNSRIGIRHLPLAQISDLTDGRIRGAVHHQCVPERHGAEFRRGPLRAIGFATEDMR
jgi:hypothetical protein